MPIKRIQKGFNISSEENRLLIEGLLEDESSVKNYSTSYLIEQHILSDFIPQNEMVARMIRRLYLRNKEEDYTVGSIMEAVYSYFAADTDAVAQEKIGKSFVDFSYNNFCINCGKRINCDKDEIPYLLKQLDYLTERVEQYRQAIVPETIEEIIRKDSLKNDLRDLEELIQLINKEPEKKLNSESVTFIYMVLRRNWDMLFNWSYTYRLLCSLTRLLIWDDTPESRMELVKLLNRFASIIDSEEKKRGFNNQVNQD